MEAIEVDKSIFLTEFRKSDKPLLIEYFKEIEIYQNTLQIPYPYTENDAEQWISLNESWLAQHPKPISFAIRDAQGTLLGGSVFHDLEPLRNHKSEIGYWLARPFWGKGIMPRVVMRLCRFGFEELNLKRITATVFSTNLRSEHVLLKCGFSYEGYLRNYYLKDGKLLDAKLFSVFPETGP